jgi:hypothetical protein
MAATKSRAMAAVVRAYALSIGKSLRTAQRHVEENHPDWVRFNQTTMIAAVSQPVTQPMSQAQVGVMASASPLAPPDLPSELRVPDSQLAEPERMLKASWMLWSQHFEMWLRCLGGVDKLGATIPPDQAMACVHANMLIKLRADYEKAVQKHTQWLIDTRRLISANEFATFRSGFLIPLRNLMQNMPAEAAPLMNPQDQATAIRGGNNWLLNRFNPQLQQAIDALDQLCPSARAA